MEYYDIDPMWHALREACTVHKSPMWRIIDDIHKVLHNMAVLDGIDTPMLDDEDFYNTVLIYNGDFVHYVAHHCDDIATLFHFVDDVVKTERDSSPHLILARNFLALLYNHTSMFSTATNFQEQYNHKRGN